MTVGPFAELSFYREVHQEPEPEHAGSEKCGTVCQLSYSMADQSGAGDDWARAIKTLRSRQDMKISDMSSSARKDSQVDGRIYSPLHQDKSDYEARVSANLVTLVLSARCLGCVRLIWS